jgi:hypothetical protein
MSVHLLCCYVTDCCLTCAPANREAMQQQQQQAALLHRPRVEEHLIGRGVGVGYFPLLISQGTVL